jgi:hypothetical protein
MEGERNMKKKFVGAILGAAVVVGVGILGTSQPANGGGEDIALCTIEADIAYDDCIEYSSSPNRCHQIWGQTFAQCMNGGRP